MNDESYYPERSIPYIETPCSPYRLEKIDSILQRRMRDFLLSRRQRQWRKIGDR